MKKIISLVLALALCMALAAPAWAMTQLQIGAGEILSGEHTFSDSIITADGDVTVESGASITFCGRFIITPSYASPHIFTVEPNATVSVNGMLNVGNNTELNIGGVFTGKCSINFFNGSINLLPGGTVDLEVIFENEANELAEALSEYGATVEKIDDGDYYYRITAHMHDFSKGDCPCGEKAPTGSILSEGNVWIIAAIAAAAVIAVGAIVIVKKKKAA